MLKTPQAVEFEEAVLGALMLEKGLINTIEDILSPDSFYNDNHKRIYEAIISLNKKSEPIDLLTVTKELKMRNDLENIGGPYILTKLTDRIASGSNSEFHARIIAQKYLQREVIRVATSAIEESYREDVDVFDLMADVEKNIASISKHLTVGKFERLGDKWKDIVERNEILRNKKGLSGVPTGYRCLDEITGGWQQPDLIIIGARPSMGKTALVCNLARNAAVEFNNPVAIFSLEMSTMQIATRFFAAEGNISLGSLVRKGVDFDTITLMSNECSRLIDAPIYIDDTPGLSLQQLRIKARKLKRERNIKLLVVDYLQLMQYASGNKGMNREQEISAISRGLKMLAKELEIPVIALSQLSRAVQSRGGDMTPKLSDLRESGAIEQDADIVIFLHRREYYGIDQFPNGESTEGIAEVIFAKNRNGATGTEMLVFIKKQTKFIDRYTPTEETVQPVIDRTNQQDLPF